MKIKINRETDCLLIIDLQNDFCSGGALEVPGGDGIVEPINRILGSFRWVAATMDWHPRNDGSFQGQGGPWPPHCIRNTKGARFHPKLRAAKIKWRVKKGASSRPDDYSGFRGTCLRGELKKRRIRRLFVAGLATEYCVQETVLDARRFHFDVFVLKDLIRGIHAKSSSRALAKMKKADAVVITARDLTLN